MKVTKKRSRNIEEGKPEPDVKAGLEMGLDIDTINLIADAGKNEKVSREEMERRNRTGKALGMPDLSKMDALAKKMFGKTQKK